VTKRNIAAENGRVNVRQGDQIGRLFTSAFYEEVQKWPKYLRHSFSKLYINFEKMGWAIFWEFFLL
jgi:hypothetical protein